MFATLDLNSVFNPPAGSPETSTVSFWDGTAAFSSGLAADSFGGSAEEPAAAGLGDESNCCSAGVGAAEEDITAGSARTAVILVNSRVIRCIIPGPLTTVVSFTKPVPGANHRSSLIDMSDESSH